MVLRLRNTLTRQVEEISTIEPGVVRMYTCGPTVYRYAHIGNLRTYLMADWIRRALEHHGYRVLHVKNITDVGHMRQEMLETGGDKVILAALAEGKTPAEIAQYYADSFHRDEKKTNIIPAHHFPWATQHVPEMIRIVETLLETGYAYRAGDNIYFDVGKFPEYGKLSGNLQDGLMEGVRSEVDPLKKDSRDFTLWKMAEPGREMKWDSPWGEGFPGWHIECSAMSTKYMGEQLDIHTGGVDNIFPHHEDEIAQSEAAFGKPYVRHWVHGQHLLADGVKMAKSAGNEFILSDLEERGFDPLAFRYLCLTARYRHRMNFTFSALRAAERALTSLRDRVWQWRSLPELAGNLEAIEWSARFWEAVDNDLDMPGALAVTWNMLHSDLEDWYKLDLLLKFDQALGLDLDRTSQGNHLPAGITSQVDRRSFYRRSAQYEIADQIRNNLKSDGYLVGDSQGTTWIRPKTEQELQQGRWQAFSSPKEVESFLDRPAEVDYSWIVTACNYKSDVERCATSFLQWAKGRSAELVVVDNGSTDGTEVWLDELQRSNPRVRVIHFDHTIGDGAAKNAALYQALGTHVIIVDTSVEVVGDVLRPIGAWLEDKSIGIIGPWGLRTDDIHHFHDEVEAGEADAMQAYCIALRRDLLKEVGLMREVFRFYRNLDLDFSFHVKDRGYRIVADGSLPLVRHEHRQWNALGEVERNQLSFQNFKKFFKKWRNRSDLLVCNQASSTSS
ncbi:MAG: cysteine--tRNA ligase [Dehalococcoidia bacterium]|nr:cysteine--tRNA ligase [Dehalococcoidia bacterium]